MYYSTVIFFVFSLHLWNTEVTVNTYSIPISISFLQILLAVMEHPAPNLAHWLCGFCVDNCKAISRSNLQVIIQFFEHYWLFFYYQYWVFMKIIEFSYTLYHKLTLDDHWNPGITKFSFRPSTGRDSVYLRVRTQESNPVMWMFNSNQPTTFHDHLPLPLVSKCLTRCGALHWSLSVLQTSLIQLVYSTNDASKCNLYYPTKSLSRFRQTPTH